MEFPPKKNYNLIFMITFLVSDLYTWIRTAPSKIHPLPDVQKFFLMPNMEI